MQIDASKIADSLPYLHLTWSGPLLLVVATFMLHHYLGAAGLAGFGVMVLSMPLNGLLARNMQRFVVRVMKARDLPLTTYYVLRTTYYLLLTTYYFVVRVMKARDLPLTAYYVHYVHYVLRTAYYVLRTAYCLLLTTSSCAW
jgi:hypothetical protein